jgi:hypothetical protein
VGYLNPTDKVQVDVAEGVHIDDTHHAILAELVYQEIKKIK